MSAAVVKPAPGRRASEAADDREPLSPPAFPDVIKTVRRRGTRGIADGVPIIGITGANGAGKTLIAVGVALDWLHNGGTVYSTVPIACQCGCGRSSTPIVSLGQLLELNDCLVLLDEVSATFPSDNAQSLPQALGLFLQVLRHRGIIVIWTAPSWMRAHKKLREVTQASINVAVMIRRPGGTSPWPTPLIIMAGLMDTTSVKTDGVPEKVLRRRLYWLTALEALGAYDTHADTPVIGFHGLSGTCPDCGGAMTRPKHSRERHDLLGISYTPEPGEPEPEAVG